MKKIENAKRKNGYKSYQKTLVEAVLWDREKKPLAEVLDGLGEAAEQVPGKIDAPSAAGTAGQVLAVGPDGKSAWVDAATGGTYDGALSDSSTNAPQNKVVTAKLTELGHEVDDLQVEVSGVQTTANAEVHQVFPSTIGDDPYGTRLRLLFDVKIGDVVSAATTAGKGVSVDIYETKNYALINGNASNLQAFTNRQYAASASGAANYNGVLVVSLCKNDSSAFTEQDKADFIAATTIVITGDSLNDKIESERQHLLNWKFDVAPSLTTTHKISGLVPNHRYRIFFRNPGWDITGVPSGSNLFRIFSYYNSVETDLVSVLADTATVAKYYDFVVPNNSDEIYLEGRGANGITIEFSVVDITDILSNGFVWDSPGYAMFALRVPTSSYAAVDNNNGTRLRVIYYVPIGTSFKVSTTEASGLHAGLSSTLRAAVYASRDIEEYTSGYQSEAQGQTSADGFLTFSLTNGSTAISDARKAEMLSSLNVFVGYGQAEDIYELQQGSSSSVAGRNHDMIDALVAVGGVNAYASGSYSNPVAKKKNLSVLALTDIHGTFDSIQSAVEFANGKTDFIDYIVCLGDVVLRSPADSISSFEDSFSNSIRPFLFVAGNHDIADTGLAGINESEARTKYFSQIVSKGWLSNFKDANSCSWYKDDGTHKIRMISVFEYGNSETIATNAPNTYCRRWIPSGTLQWFADTLYSTPSDYSVVVMLHQVPFFPATYVDGKFTISEDMRISLGNFFLNTIDGNPFGDIVNAFVTGANISQTYDSIAAYGLGKSASVSKDFSQRGTGNFICFVVGHFHGSYVFADVTYPGLKTIAVPSDSRSVYQQQYGDTNYVPNTRNEDQFYVIGFDTDKKIINIAKIGGQVTNDMVKRDIISIKY